MTAFSAFVRSHTQQTLQWDGRTEFGLRSHDSENGRPDRIRANGRRGVDRTSRGFFPSKDPNWGRSRIALLSGINTRHRHRTVRNGVWHHCKAAAGYERRAATRYSHRSRRQRHSRREIEQEDREVAKSPSAFHKAYRNPWYWHLPTRSDGVA